MKVASVNCRGLGDFYKRRDIFAFLREKDCSIYLLQDTHFSNKIEDRVKREWGYDAYFSSFSSNSRGVAILVKNDIEYKFISITKDINGNYLILRVKIFDKEIVIVNVYGPNADTPDFYIHLEETVLSTGATDNFIFGGDWNLVLNFDMDCCNYRRQNNVKASEKVLDMMNNMNLVDIYRMENPSTRRYTWRRSTPLQQSRLDFFLISNELVPIAKEIDIIPGYKTDHSIITLGLQFGGEGQRNQFWKFNTSLLSDKEYLDIINSLITEVIKEYAATPYNMDKIDSIPISEIQLLIDEQLFLDVLLMKIRSQTISYSSFKKKTMSENEQRLLREIHDLEKIHNPNVFEQETLKEKQEELINIRDFRLRGVLLRSRARWVENGEKVSSYFCSLEKRNVVNKCINKLTVDNDHVITDKAKIVDEIQSFYKQLYSKRDVLDAAVSDLVNDIPTLTDPEASELEGHLTLDEITYALKNMKNGKSPGSDGFPVDFFKVFWRQLGGFVLRSLNAGFDKGEMSSTQKEGVIILLPKTEDSRDKIKNWRPISLLNTVYKIGSASISNRLKTVLPKLIHEDQTGFLKNRFIGDNVRLIYDIISYLTSENKPGLLLCLDFEKAFDSLDWSFLHKVLIAFGFKEDIRKWICAFYNNIRSTVSVNGSISQWFSIGRGCRQGDPISPYLFIICVEIMGIMIRQNDRIKGISINNNEFKLTQYADDSELILEGDRQSFEESIQTIQLFGQYSGLILNAGKTNAIWLGSKRNSRVRYMQHLDMTWNPAKFKVLGIWFSNVLSECIDLNYKDKMLEIKNLYRIWLKRQITPLGRIAILKSLILSKLIYLWILLPNPPDHIVQEIQKDVFSFVWNKKNDRISRKTSVYNIENGGIGVPNIRCYLDALKVTWIRKLATTNHNWKLILFQSAPATSNLDALGAKLATGNMNLFWKHVFQAYVKIEQNIKVDCPEFILQEPIFYNTHIQINNDTIFYNNWFTQGITHIKHLIKADGSFYSFGEFITFTI